MVFQFYMPLTRHRPAVPRKAVVWVSEDRATQTAGSSPFNLALTCCSPTKPPPAEPRRQKWRTPSTSHLPPPLPPPPSLPLRPPVPEKPAPPPGEGPATSRPPPLSTPARAAPAPPPPGPGAPRGGKTYAGGCSGPRSSGRRSPRLSRSSRALIRASPRSSGAQSPQGRGRHPVCYQPNLYREGIADVRAGQLRKTRRGQLFGTTSPASTILLRQRDLDIRAARSVPGQPRTQAIRGWPGVRGWPGLPH